MRKIIKIVATATVIILELNLFSLELTFTDSFFLSASALRTYINFFQERADDFTVILAESFFSLENQSSFASKRSNNAGAEVMTLITSGLLRIPRAR